MKFSNQKNQRKSEVFVYQPFMFVDDWNLSYNCKTLRLTREDLDNYHENGLTDEEIKSIAFSYLSKQVFLNLDKPYNTTHEL